MQQFTIPQFIDVEDKVIGPLTTRQFLILLVGAIIIAISYKIFDFALFVTVGVFIFAVFGTVAFIKINGRPFHFFILNIIQTFKRPMLRVWNYKIENKAPVKEEALPVFNSPEASVKHFTASRLAELSLVVDTGGNYKGENNKEIKIESI
jgi:hypothetical protein